VNFFTGFFVPVGKVSVLPDSGDLAKAGIISGILSNFKHLQAWNGICTKRSVPADSDRSKYK